MSAKRVKPSQKEFIPKREVFLRSEIKVLAGLLALILLFRWKVFLNFNTSLLGGVERDAGLYSWLVRSNVSDLFSLSWFNTQAFYPYSLTLAWSDNFILPSLFVIPFLTFGLSLAASWNVLLITTTLLNGYCTYRLAFQLSGELLFSFVAGAGFMLCSYLTGNLGHPQLQFAFFIPLALIATFNFLRVRSFLSAFIAGFVTSLAFLTCVYYAIIIPVCIGSILLSVALTRPFFLIPRRCIRFILGYACGLLPVIPFVLPYLEVRDTFGARFLYEPYYFAADTLSYLSSFPLRLVYGTTSILSHAEAYLFPGLVLLFALVVSFYRISQIKKLRPYWVSFVFLLLLTCVSSIYALDNNPVGALCALASWGSLLSFMFLIKKLGALELKLKVKILTNRDIIAALLLIALIAFLISLGPLGNSTVGDFAFGIHRVFYEIIPGFDSLRAIARIGIVVILCCYLCIPFALRRVKKKTGHPHLLACIAFILICIENYHTTYPLEHLEPRTTVFSYLESTAKKNQAVMILPWTSEISPNGQVKSWGDFAEKNVRYMHWAKNIPGYLVNGYSGQRSYIMKEFPRKMSGFPDERSLNSLSSIPGLSYVVYSSNYASKDFSAEEMFDKVQDYQGQLSFIIGDDDGNFLFEFHPRLKLNDSFYLRVPSYPKGVIHVDLLAVSTAGQKSSKVKFVLRDHFPEAPIAEANVPADTEWHTFSIPIPKTSDSVRPLRLYFSAESDSTVFIGDSEFVPLKENM